MPSTITVPPASAYHQVMSSKSSTTVPSGRTGSSRSSAARTGLMLLRSVVAGIPWMRAMPRSETPSRRCASASRTRTPISMALGPRRGGAGRCGVIASIRWSSAWGEKCGTVRARASGVGWSGEVIDP